MSQSIKQPKTPKTPKKPTATNPGKSTKAPDLPTADGSTQPTLEQSIQQLEQAVAWFEGSEFSLSHAAERYQQVQRLAAQIQTQLDELEHTITMVVD